MQAELKDGSGLKGLEIKWSYIIMFVKSAVARIKIQTGLGLSEDGKYRHNRDTRTHISCLLSLKQSEILPYNIISFCSNGSNSLNRRRTNRSVVFTGWRQSAPHLIRGSLGPQTASRTVQLF